MGVWGGGGRGDDGGGEDEVRGECDEWGGAIVRDGVKVFHFGQ